MVCRKVHVIIFIIFLHTGAIAAKNGFGTSFIPTFINSVSCFGNESSIFDCTIDYEGSDSCGPFADAGVICQSIHFYTVYILVCYYDY